MMSEAREEENGDPDYVSSVALSTSHFVPLGLWVPGDCPFQEEKVLFTGPGAWGFGEKGLVVCTEMKLISTIFNWVVFHIN